MNKNLSNHTLTERQAEILEAGKEIQEQALWSSMKSAGHTQNFLKKRKRSEEGSDRMKKMSEEMHEQKKKWEEERKEREAKEKAKRSHLIYWRRLLKNCGR